VPFNPCGYKVQYLREEGTDIIRPFSDSDLEVTRRWYRAADDAPWLPFPSVFRSTRWEPFPYRREGAGSVWPAGWRFKRVGEVQGFGYDHFCGTEADFNGQALFDPERDVVYDDEWIPECCGRLSVCVTQLCSQDQENARPAAQLRSYPIPHQDADETTPVVIQHWPSRAVPGDPSWPGYVWEWFPVGEDGAVAVTDQVVSDELGQLQYRDTLYALPAGLTMRETRDADGLTFLLDNGVTAGTLTAKINLGKVELCGTNAVICEDLLPPALRPWKHAVVTAVGTTQATAAPVTTASVALSAGGTAGAGVILPAGAVAPTQISIANPSASRTFQIYPAVGETFVTPVSLNTPITIAVQTVVVLLRIGTFRWKVIFTGSYG